MAKRGRPVKYNADKMVKVLEEYTNNTEIPILKEVCYQNKWNDRYIHELAAKNENLSESINNLLMKKDSHLERLGLQGKIDRGVAIFSLKQLGWKDNQQIDHSGSVNIIVETPGVDDGV